MTDPKTKIVLGRVFTWNPSFGDWECTTLAGTVVLEQDEFQDRWRAELGRENDPQSIASGTGPTEADAILALQSTLRKMALLEVVGG